jgi:hypothetical protein
MNKLLIIVCLFGLMAIGCGPKDADTSTASPTADKPVPTNVPKPNKPAPTQATTSSTGETAPITTK